MYTARKYTCSAMMRETWQATFAGTSKKVQQDLLSILLDGVQVLMRKVSSNLV